MRRALIVGIDHYEWSPLNGCINDANEIHRLLDRNEDGTPNFDCKKLTSGKGKKDITRTYLRKQIHELFNNQADIALLYFSGHGVETPYGGYLMTEDAYKFDEGVSMNDVLILANQSKVGEVIIILDCCYSGGLGSFTSHGNMALLREGITIITSSADYQVSKENQGMGVFTRMISEALEGEAADILGNVTVAGLYGYSDKSLTAWDQRPVFKSHVTTMLPIRKSKPKIELEILRKLIEYFETEEKEYALDPCYEPDSKSKCMKPNLKKQAIFKDLQKCTSKGLVTPIGEDHMYYAAMNSKSCKLTPLGQYYWKLAKYNLI